MHLMEVPTYLLLVDHVALRLCQNALKVSSSEALQLNTDWQTTLQFNGAAAAAAAAEKCYQVV
jgi:hypothetical protein